VRRQRISGRGEIHATIQGMLTFRFGAEDLLRTRFAISPLDELGRAFRIARDPHPPLAHATWAPRARDRLATSST